MRDSWNWDVYNNTVYDNGGTGGAGLVLADWIGDGVPDNVNVMNNIIYGNGSREMMALHGAHSNNNVFQFNNFEEGPGFVRWGTNTYYDTVAEWGLQESRAVHVERGLSNPSTCIRRSVNWPACRCRIICKAAASPL